MILTCPSCSSRYFLAEEPLGAGREVRCTACGHVWRASPELAAAAPPKPPRRKKTRPPANPTAGTLSPAAMVRARQAALLRQRQRRHAALAWGGAGLALGCAFGLAVAMREPLTRAWPRAATAFAALGAPVNIYGVAVESVELSRDPADPEASLRVRGVLHNITKKTVTGPEVVLTLEAASGEALAHAYAPPSQRLLRPGERATFSIRLDDPPLEAQAVSISLGRSGFGP